MTARPLFAAVPHPRTWSFRRWSSVRTWRRSACVSIPANAFRPNIEATPSFAQHGSWNRSTPDGYRVVRVRFDAEGRAAGYVPFIEGWLSGSTAWGRPVDLLQLPDGSLLISDDRAGAVYRVDRP